MKLKVCSVNAWKPGSMDSYLGLNQTVNEVALNNEGLEAEGFGRVTMHLTIADPELAKTFEVGAEVEVTVAGK